MSDESAFVLLGTLAVAAFAVHMLLRPHVYLGKGTAPIRDPRVVRGFGIFFLILAGTIAGPHLRQFVSE
jgi:hypothetical protein